MANLSKLQLPDSTLVTLKDNSQTNSDHRHYEKDIVPLVHKVYESTSYYATAANWDKSSWYFASIKPDSWYLPWKIKFKIHSYCPGYPANESVTYAMVTGRSDSMSYANWNEVQTTAHYYTVWYPLKKAGFDAGYGHAFGVSIYAANNYTSSSYYRTFEIDFIECENCTVTILDNPVLWENWTGTGTTYYSSRGSGNAGARGLQETGDTDTTVHNRIQYFNNWTGEVGIWSNSLSMLNSRMEVENICTAADGTVTTSNKTTATTKKANTHGFKVGSPLWYSNTAYNRQTQIATSSVIYSSYSLIDVRYCFNIDLANPILSDYGPMYNGEPVFLVGYIKEDGLFYLRQDKWWEMIPNPTKYGEDAVYVLVGYIYDCTSSSNRFTLLEENIWYKYSTELGTIIEYPFFNEKDAKKRFVDTFTDKLVKINTAYTKPLEELKIDLPYNSEGITSVTVTHCGENLCNPNTLINGYKIDNNTGALVENSDYSVSDYIFIPKGSGLSEFADTLWFYDLNKQPIMKCDESLQLSYIYPYTEDCYIRLSSRTGYICYIQKGLVYTLKRNASAPYQAEEKTIDLSSYSIYGGYIVITPNSAKLYSTYNLDGTKKTTADEYDLSNVTNFTTYIGANHFFNDIHSELTITAILDGVPYSASSGGINYCETDSSSTATAFVVNGTGLTSLTNGTILCIKNTKVTSDDSGCTINVDGLGAKTVWLSETNSACKDEWKNNTTYLFVFDAVNDRWIMQTGRDEDINANNIIARYSKLPIGGNGVNRYSLFAMLEDGTASSFTTNSGSGEKTFDNTHYFDIRKIFNFMLMNDRAAGSTLSASSWKFQGFDVDMRYSFTGVTTSANTSSLTADNPVYLVFDPSATQNGYYKLKSPYYTQSPTSAGCIYVLLGVMRDSYRLDLWGYNPAFTYNGTNLIPFSNASFAGLADTYISNPAPCDVLMFDGADWVNSNIIPLKDSNLHTTIVLNGNTGDVQASSLNGAALGENPEFTDTQSDWNASSGKAQILNKPTLGTASGKDVPITGNASATQVVMGNDTRITETTETYGNLFSIEPQTVNGVTISVAADGTVTFNGTASKTFYVYIKGEKLPAGTYTAKMTVVSGTSSSNSQPSLRYGTTYNADGTRWVNNSTKQDTKTLNSESYVYLMVYKNTVTTNYTVKYQIEKGSTVGEYEPQSISAVDKEARKFIEKNTPSFIVPSTSIAVVGHEYNIYFDNIINGMDFSRYTVKASLSTSIESAKCFEKFFRFTPTSTDIGNNTITLTLCEKNKFTLIATCSIALKIIADSPISNKKVLFIGDSLTNAGVYEAEIQYNLSNGGITSLGTRETTCTVNGISRTVHHEGRGGWSAADYTRSKSTWATGIENPFYDETNHKFSFTYYMNTSGVDVPDIVCIGLGTNGNINCLDDVLEMVTSIREYSNTIPIIVSLLTPPAYQNGCGYYNHLQNSAEMKDRFLQCCENYIENYDNGEIANTDVAELYFHFDREYDFNTTTLPVSARNPNTMVVQSNNVHPSEYGYLHFADGYYNRILYWLTR